MANQKYKFERLTPIDNMDLDVYEEAIDYVFSNSDVKNVAISGAYSAGKSSVLASYKKKHGELRFLHISLAHFKSTDQKSKAKYSQAKRLAMFCQPSYLYWIRKLPAVPVEVSRKTL